MSNVGFQSWNSQNTLSELQTGKTLISEEAVLIWVCTVTLGTLGREGVFKILEHLRYINFVLCICLNDAHGLQDTFAWVKVFRINPEFRILRLTFHRMLN